MSSSPITLFDRTLPPYAERTGHVLEWAMWSRVEKPGGRCWPSWSRATSSSGRGTVPGFGWSPEPVFGLGHLTPLVLGNAGDTTAVVATVRRGSAAMTGRIADERRHYPTQRP